MLGKIWLLSSLHLTSVCVGQGVGDCSGSFNRYMFRSAVSVGKLVSRTSQQTMQSCSTMAHASSSQCGLLPVRAGLRQAEGDQPLEQN